MGAKALGRCNDGKRKARRPRSPGGQARTRRQVEGGCGSPAKARRESNHTPRRTRVLSAEGPNRPCPLPDRGHGSASIRFMSDESLARPARKPKLRGARTRARRFRRPRLSGGYDRPGEEARPAGRRGRNKRSASKMPRASPSGTGRHGHERPAPTKGDRGRQDTRAQKVRSARAFVSARSEARSRAICHDGLSVRPLEMESVTELAQLPGREHAPR